MDTRSEYRKLVNEMGKKEFTFLKMQEYGFWPSHLPTPYERQQNETEQDFENRKKLLDGIIRRAAFFCGFPGRANSYRGQVFCLFCDCFWK